MSTSAVMTDEELSKILLQLDVALFLYANNSGCTKKIPVRDFHRIASRCGDCGIFNTPALLKLLIDSAPSLYKLQGDSLILLSPATTPTTRSELFRIPTDSTSDDLICTLQQPAYSVEETAMTPPPTSFTKKEELVSILETPFSSTSSNFSTNKVTLLHFVDSLWIYLRQKYTRLQTPNFFTSRTTHIKKKRRVTSLFIATYNELQEQYLRVKSNSTCSFISVLQQLIQALPHFFPNNPQTEHNKWSKDTRIFISSDAKCYQQARTILGAPPQKTHPLQYHKHKNNREGAVSLSSSKSIPTNPTMNTHSNGRTNDNIVAVDSFDELPQSFDVPPPQDKLVGILKNIPNGTNQTKHSIVGTLMSQQDSCTLQKPLPQQQEQLDPITNIKPTGNNQPLRINGYLEFDNTPFPTNNKNGYCARNEHDDARGLKGLFSKLNAGERI